MFEAKIADGSVLKKTVEAVKEVVNEANFECTSTGICVQAMDTSHVSLISLMLSSELFSDYRCDRNLVIGVNIADVHKILRCAASTDSISLSCQDDGENLTFVFVSKEGDKVSKFSSKLMNIEMESLAIPELRSETIITMPSQKFSEIVKDVSQFSESMVISTSKDCANFIAKDSALCGSISLLYDEGKPSENLKIEHTGSVKQTFSVRFLHLFAKAYGLSSNVKLLIQNELPICVEYNIEPKSFLKFYLAPGFNDDEEAEDAAEK